ncbi:hypothetical protein VULLAG_LOCUS2150 [Vulpes lagopus]
MITAGRAATVARDSKVVFLQIASPISSGGEAGSQTPRMPQEHTVTDPAGAQECTVTDPAGAQEQTVTDPAGAPGAHGHRPRGRPGANGHGPHGCPRSAWSRTPRESVRQILLSFMF